jgi:hypothetical protein
MNNEEDFEDFNVVVVFDVFKVAVSGSFVFVLCFLFFVCVCVWLKG